MNNDSIYLMKRMKVITRSFCTESKPCIPLLATVVKELEHYGYGLDLNCINYFKDKPKELTRWFGNIIDFIKESKGNIDIDPLYPNFPRSVMSRSDSHLFLDAVIYWLTNYEYKPEEKEPREMLKDDVKLTMICVGDYEDFLTIGNNLLESNVPLSDKDYEILDYLFDHNIVDVESISLIKMREIKSYIAKRFYTSNKHDFFDKYANIVFDTFTDVLRFITNINDGDISLAENTRYKSMPRYDRKQILIVLDNLAKKKPIDDFYVYRDKWINVFKVLHPEDYPQFNNIYKYVKTLRNKRKLCGYGYELYEALNKKDLANSLRLIKQRPGIFARKLDYILRECCNTRKDLNLVLDTFKEMKDLPTNTLMTIMTHFENRKTDSNEMKIAFPKGNLNKAHSFINTARVIDWKTCCDVIDICKDMIIDNLKQKNSLEGRLYYIDPTLKEILIPTKDCSNSCQKLTRGSKLKLDDKTNFIRLFTFWMENEWATDLDLSALKLSDEFEKLGTVNYSHLKDNDDEDDTLSSIVHSGDVRRAPKPDGGCEFIDIDLNNIQCLGESCRYIAITLTCFKGETFDKCAQCYAGYMEREDNFNGEIFEPKTVKYKSDIKTPGKQNVPLLFDIKERKVIFVDVSYDGSFASSINTEANSVNKIIQGILNVERGNLYDLFELNVLARGGHITINKEEADFVFGLDGNITPYMGDVILSEYL